MSYPVDSAACDTSSSGKALGHRFSGDDHMSAAAAAGRPVVSPAEDTMLSRKFAAVMMTPSGNISVAFRHESAYSAKRMAVEWGTLGHATGVVDRFGELIYRFDRMTGDMIAC